MSNEAFAVLVVAAVALYLLVMAVRLTLDIRRASKPDTNNNGCNRNPCIWPDCGANSGCKPPWYNNRERTTLDVARKVRDASVNPERLPEHPDRLGRSPSRKGY